MKRAGSKVIAACLAAASLATPASADVWVYGNGATLNVLVYGNEAQTPDLLRAAASAISSEPWHPLWQGDDSEPGWIAVSCVRRRPDRGVHFTFATAQPSEAVAIDLSRRSADQHISRHGGTLIQGCGGSVEHRGQPLRVRFVPTAQATDQPAPTVTEVSLPPSRSADERGEHQAVAERYRERALSDPDQAQVWTACAAAALKRASGSVEDADAQARQLSDVLKLIVDDPERNPCEDAIPPEAWAGVEPAPAESSPARDEAPSDLARALEQVRQQEETARQQVETLNANILEQHREIDSRNAAAQAEFEERNAAHQAELIRAEAERQRHEAQMDAHRRELALADAAGRRYEEEMDAYQGRRNVRFRDFPEGIAVCVFETEDPQSKFDNWTCHGPLQTSYAKLGDTGLAVSRGALVQIGLSCGTDAERVSDLGMIGRYHLFGCGFGRNPDQRHLRGDQAVRFGIEQVPGRRLYRCRADRSSCSTQ